MVSLVQQFFYFVKKCEEIHFNYRVALVKKDRLFDSPRLVEFGSKENSILSINSFRALDTTRIFVNLTSDIYVLEDKFINQMEKSYLLNRTAGGALDGLPEAIAKMKTRDFSI